MKTVLNPYTGELDLTGDDGGGGGAGTVTSVAGGIGITNTPEPIVGAGVVDLDLGSLAVEGTLAAGDLFPFVDVSVGLGPAAQRVTTFANLVADIGASLDHGTLLGLLDDDHPQYLLLAGRAGTTNDPLISTNATGTITGSGVTGEGLTLVPNDADATGKLGLIDPSLAYVANNVFGVPALIVGAAVDPVNELAGGNDVSSIGIFDNNACVFSMRGDTVDPKFVQISFLDAATAPNFTIFRGRGSSYATRTQPNVSDGMFFFGCTSFDNTGTQQPDFAGAFGYEVDGVFPGYVTARLGFSILFDDGVRRHPVYVFPNDLVALGADQRTVVTGNPLPTDQTIHMESWQDGKVTAVIKATPGQTVDLTQWRDDAENVLTFVDEAGVVSVPELRFLEPGGANFSAFVAQAQAGDITYILPAADAAGALTSDGAGNLSWAASSGTPGGVDMDVQFNDGGTFGGDSNFQWDTGAAKLTVTGDVEVTGKLTVGGVIDPTQVIIQNGDTLAPLVVDSDILCVNLNADLLDGLHASAFQLVDADLTAIAALTGTGIAVRTAADTWALRTLTAPAAGITITNPAGVAGNPTFALANDLAALEGLGSTGIAVRSAADTWVQRSIAVTDTASVDLTITNGDGVSGNPTISATVLAAGVDHGGLGGLGDDDHSQYALLAGRAGGQHLKGGTASGEDLTLESTNDGTKGTIFVRDEVDLGANITSIGNATRTLLTYNQTLSLTHANAILIGFDVLGTWTQSTASSGSTINLFRSRPTITNSGAGVTTLPQFKTLNHSPTYDAAVASTILAEDAAVIASPTFTRSGSGTWAFGDHKAFASRIAVGSGVTLSSRTGLKIDAHTGAGAITTDIGVDIATLLGGTNISLRSSGPDVQMRHAGPVMIGVNAAPTTTAGNMLEIDRNHSTGADITDGRSAGITLDPAYTGTGGIRTITRHNYIRLENTNTSSAVVTDSAALWFDANTGTHTALAANGTVVTTITSLGPTGAQTTIQGWLKINVNGTLRYIPFW